MFPFVQLYSLQCYMYMLTVQEVLRYNWFACYILVHVVKVCCFQYFLKMFRHGWAQAFAMIRQPHIKYVCPTA